METNNLVCKNVVEDFEVPEDYEWRADVGQKYYLVCEKEVGDFQISVHYKRGVEVTEALEHLLHDAFHLEYEIKIRTQNRRAYA